VSISPAKYKVTADLTTTLRQHGLESVVLSSHAQTLAVMAIERNISIALGQVSSVYQPSDTYCNHSVRAISMHQMTGKDRQRRAIPQLVGMYCVQHNVFGGNCEPV
jgi:hypothetical protein